MRRERNFESQFNSDGKIDFKSRVGMSKDKDPFRNTHYQADSNERVTFDEHRDIVNRLDHSVIDYDNDDDVNLDW